MKVVGLKSAWKRLRDFAASRSGKGLSAATLYQAATYLLPLITFPYLARVLGVEGFGLVGLATAVVGYALLVTEWAFGLTATQAVAQSQGDAAAVNRIIWSTLLAKTCLGLVCGAAIGIGALFAPADLRPVLWASIVTLVGMIISVDWALRGVHATTSFAATSIIGRAAAVPLIFILVRDRGDAAMAVFSLGVGGLITGALGIWRGVRMGLIGRPETGVGDAWRAIRGGAHVFGSMAMTSLYTNTVTAGLGLFAGTAQVGLFAAADRVRKPFATLLSPINLVFFPRMGELAASDPPAAERMARRLLMIQGGAALLLTLALIASAPLVVRILLGDAFDPVVPVLQIQAGLIFLTGLSNVLGLMIMLPFGMKRAFTLCILSGAIVGLTALFPLAHSHGALGASIAACLAEFSVTATMVFALRRRFSWVRLGRVRYA
ncbi:oligosaccharide flippase family protein [Brevundimonas sp. NIBR11]|uniref:oligosaccharide flippase family protein n=1 Tax=Brevundimonas sp. NIBR11 TaxID=3015999 RepID=UPI0022EFEA8F|nr:oligosaccharide flippase family protein [Brevundimonas sp. NIBR11]WGM31826.1 Putative O-antigen transporter [Brevundimonas sp. NIBR11]